MPRQTILSANFQKWKIQKLPRPNVNKSHRGVQKGPFTALSINGHKYSEIKIKYFVKRKILLT